MGTKLLSVIELDKHLYYFDGDIFGKVDSEDPCINQNGNGSGSLMSTILPYKPMSSGAMYKIWGTTNPEYPNLNNINPEDLEEFNKNPFQEVEIEIDSRTIIPNERVGNPVTNAMLGMPTIEPSGFLRVYRKIKKEENPDWEIVKREYLKENNFDRLTPDDSFVFEWLQNRFQNPERSVAPDLDKH